MAWGLFGECVSISQGAGGRGNNCENTAHRHLSPGLALAPGPPAGVRGPDLGTCSINHSTRLSLQVLQAQEKEKPGCALLYFAVTLGKCMLLSGLSAPIWKGNLGSSPGGHHSVECRLSGSEGVPTPSSPQVVRAVVLRNSRSLSRSPVRTSAPGGARGWALSIHPGREQHGTQDARGSLHEPSCLEQTPASQAWGHCTTGLLFRRNSPRGYWASTVDFASRPLRVLPLGG